MVPQVVEDGYEFFARRQLVTIFSAPNYCGEFDNAGAMMSVDDSLMCSFQVKPSLDLLTACLPRHSHMHHASPSGRIEEGRVRPSIEPLLLKTV